MREDEFKEQNDEIVIDLREIFGLLRAKIAVILITAIIFTAAAGIYSFFIANPVYEATSKLFILTKTTSITSLADIQMGASLTSDYMELIKSRPVVDRVCDNLNLDTEYEVMLQKLTVENPADTRILRLKVKDHDPAMAKIIADEFAVVAQKHISEIMKVDEPTIAEHAHKPEKPISPAKGKNMIFGFVIGVILSIGFIIAQHMLNDTISSKDDIGKYLGLNTLAVVPLKSGTQKTKKHGRVARFNKKKVKNSRKGGRR